MEMIKKVLDLEKEFCYVMVMEILPRIIATMLIGLVLAVFILISLISVQSWSV
jgi:flagellar biosynthesis protein FliQ